MSFEYFMTKKKRICIAVIEADYFISCVKQVLIGWASEANDILLAIA